MLVALLDSRNVPTTTVSPETATLHPNWSSASVFDALRYACWLQTPAFRTNTYAAPELIALLFDPSPFTPVALLSSPMAPTTAVSPETATLNPNSSLLPVLDAF